jgi:Fe-S-cluster containining protein
MSYPDCSKCGSCCKTVALKFSPSEIESKMKDIIKDIRRGKQIGPNAYDIYFIFMYFERISRRTAEKINPNLRKWGKNLYFYKCRELKPDGTCGEYYSRPTFCRNYPNFHLKKFPIYNKKCAYVEWENEVKNGRYL